MAVKAIETLNRYDFIGLAVDVKPTDHIKDGALFIESDTRDIYVFHNGTWSIKDEGLMYVWDPVTMTKVKMTQPLIDATGSNLYIQVDALEDLTRDTLDTYKVANFAVSSDPYYVGKVDKSGAWYISKIAIAAGYTKYCKGADNYAAAWAGRAGLTYVQFDAAF